MGASEGVPANNSTMTQGEAAVGPPFHPYGKRTLGGCQSGMWQTVRASLRGHKLPAIAGHTHIAPNASLAAEEEKADPLLEKHVSHPPLRGTFRVAGAGADMNEG